MFDKIKYYYTQGLWTKGQVYKIVGKGLTEAEYKQITGEKYK